MTPLSRRQFLWTTAASGVAWPILARQQREATAAGGRFQHGVASGDPLTDRVILWTRITPSDPTAARAVDVRWRVGTDASLRQVVASGTAQTSGARDYTVKVDAGGLRPGVTYYYAFDSAGEQSPVGRTKTLPAGEVGGFRLALVSCSNYPAGFFNVYRCIANRPDLDAVVHVGDYIYEFGEAEYGAGADIGRVPQPPREAVTLSDYRIRYATYRTDVDLQEAHRLFPFLAVWDDHEITNDTWSGGASNHNPERGEGDWATRKGAAYKAYLEWMPIRESSDPGIHLYRTFAIGNLANLVMIDTRSQRDRQVAANNATALADPSRTMLGAAQEQWLFDELRMSNQSGRTWTLLGQQVIFAPTTPPGMAAGNPDTWDGYVGQRERVFDFLERERLRNLVILTGDAHSSWALDVPRAPWKNYRTSTGEGSLAVEMVTPAISSTPPSVFSGSGGEGLLTALRIALPHLKFLDGQRRGYVLVALTPQSMAASWFFVPDVRTRSSTEIPGPTLICERGSNHFQQA